MSDISGPSHRRIAASQMGSVSMTNLIGFEHPGKTKNEAQRVLRGNNGGLDGLGHSPAEEGDP